MNNLTSLIEQQGLWIALALFLIAAGVYASAHRKHPWLSRIADALFALAVGCAFVWAAVNWWT
jgi:hypothetical protein